MKQQLLDAERAADILRATRNDRWYPTFHIAARAGWINDPNGLSYFDGRHHVFFQHNPRSEQWGPMHWGHVSSADMLTWRREPIALAPSIAEDRDGVFSGSAIEGPDGTLLAYYTGHRWRNGVNEDEGNLQVQCMAESRDGVHFEKLGMIVDCPEGLPHFRDPKVFVHEGTGYMIFGASSAGGRGQVWMYTSTDMREWTFDRILFEDPDPDVFMLECPDFFPLGDSWVLLYCPMGLRKRGYDHRNDHTSGYVVGEWAPGREFNQRTDFAMTDFGAEFYAPQTYLTPDGRRVLYAWMGSFTIPAAPQIDGDGWFGQLTVPRELWLDDRLRLRNRPITELDGLRRGGRDLGELRVGTNQTLPLVDDAPTADITLRIDLEASTAERMGIIVHRTAPGRGTYIAYDAQSSRVIVDRRTTGPGNLGYRSYPVEGGELTLRILLDRGSVEVFIGDGEASISSYSFPAEGARGIELLAESGEMHLPGLAIHQLGGIWEDDVL
ncbi:glycoside hydrolase family 32 protein [Corynebacterium pacaense]|uniref:glycoside hydrolase family 32 protein n=1 Tax=Corynebacterium pacaense TaxID=1816684 RepID=UPI0009BAFA72|nr:glycoside hydrolase family 32 protein [Corynebacterium pacaense]